MKNILVAIDFSNATDAVIHQIGKLACPNDSIIHLLHIVEPSICYEVSGVLPDEVPVPVMDQTEENEVIFALADVDQDVMITVQDAVYILTYYAQKACGMQPTWKELIGVSVRS